MIAHLLQFIADLKSWERLVLAETALNPGKRLATSPTD
jgi:hypothetical protein